MDKDESMWAMLAEKEESDVIDKEPGGGGAVEQRTHSRTLSRQHLASSSVVEAGNLINLPRHKQFPP